MDSSKLQDVGVTLAFAWSLIFYGVLICAFASMVFKALHRLAKGQLWRTGVVLSSVFLLFGVFWGCRIADMSSEIVRAETAAMGQVCAKRATQQSDQNEIVITIKRKSAF